MKKVEKFLLAGIVAAFPAFATDGQGQDNGNWQAILAQQEAQEDSPPPELRVHPRYGPTESEPLDPDPTIEEPRVQLEATPQLVSELRWINVFTAEYEKLGTIDDVIVDVANGRVIFVMIRPATNLVVDPEFSYAVAPEVIRLENDRVAMDVQERDLSDAPILSEDQLQQLLAAFVSAGPEEIRDRLPAYRIERETPVYGAPALRQPSPEDEVSGPPIDEQTGPPIDEQTGPPIDERPNGPATRSEDGRQRRDRENRY